MITAQVLSVIAAGISWIWNPGWAVSLVTFLLLQFVWCCRQTRGALVFAAALAIFSALCQLGVGIAMRQTWQRAVQSFACGSLWLVVGFCIFRFVLGGNHAKWEEIHGGVPSAMNHANNANDHTNTMEL